MTIFEYEERKANPENHILSKQCTNKKWQNAYKKGREAQTSMVIVDSKSIKNTDLAEEKGYDAEKKHPG